MMLIEARNNFGEGSWMKIGMRWYTYGKKKHILVRGTLMILMCDSLVLIDFGSTSDVVYTFGVSSPAPQSSVQLVHRHKLISITIRLIYA